MPERTRSCSGRQTSSPNEFVRRGQLRDVFVRGKRATTSRGVHVNGGLAITGYSDPRHGIPRVPSPWNFSYVHVYLAPLRPPFYVVRTWLRWKGEKERERNPRGGRKGRGGEALLEEKKRGKMREGEKSVRTSLRGFSRPATYGNVIRAFRWMLSCVFALLRNHVVLPSRSTLPSSFFFPYLAFFAFSPQKESMSMRKRFVSMFLLDFRLMCPKETSKIRVYAAGDWHFPTLPSQRGIITFGFFRRGSILTRLWW